LLHSDSEKSKIIKGDLVDIVEKENILYDEITKLLDRHVKEYEFTVFQVIGILESVKHPVVSTQISVHLAINSGAWRLRIRLFISKSLFKLEEIATVSANFTPSGIVTTISVIQNTR
jgi:hypothetical protein